MDLYFNLVPVQLGNPYFQFASTLIFFPLAYYIAKWVGLDGLKGIGLVFHKGWLKNFLFSFGFGFVFWLVWYGIEFWGGQLEFVGFKKPAEVIMPVILVLVGFFVGSIINDLIIRGYLFTLLKKKIQIGWAFSISILIYALDDYWYAGFSLSNVIFSIILGLSLTFAFYKTGSIWADTGIHYGLNVAYGLLFGLVGNSGSAVFIIKETGHETVLSNSLYYLVPAAMFIFVLWFIRFYSNHVRTVTNVPFSG
ncbi:CPBP family intramembrane glutamic endopeptidase [Neobacillus vireti]|uniref:CPBP family intramembrane glutamic endopeptidase n=1 Tax=Neobacillus vireti TaxID=220686 RepID=UPI0003F80A4B|nr:CPBP family intramembrane glutamic endopeptidase [Neobacillus vireti]